MEIKRIPIDYLAVGLLLFICLVNTIRYVSDPLVLYGRTGDLDHFLIVNNVYHVVKYGRVAEFSEIKHLTGIHFFLARLLHIFLSDINQITMLITSVLIALGVIPVFLIVRKVFPNCMLARIVFPIIYLMFPSFDNSVRFTPYWTYAAPVFILFTFYFVLTKRYRLYLLFLILTAYVKEDSSVVVVSFFGVYYYMLHWKGNTERYKNFVRWILVPFVIGMLYFFIVADPFFKFFHGEESIARLLHFNIGDDLLSIVLNIITKPAKTLSIILEGGRGQYLYDTFLQTGFLPLYAPQMLIVLIPTLLENILMETSIFKTYIYLHTRFQNYTNAFIMIALIYGFKKFLKFMGSVLMKNKDYSRKFSSVMVIIMLISITVINEFWYGRNIFLEGSFLHFSTENIPANFYNRYPDGINLAKRIPPNSTVFVDIFLSSYVYDKKRVHWATNYNENELNEADSYDYVLLTTDDEVYHHYRAPTDMHRSEFIKRLNNNFTTTEIRGNTILLKNRNF